MNRSTKSRLTVKQLSWFPGNTLFEKIGRSVCRVGTLPGKELFEAWEVARRVRRKFRGGRVVDLSGWQQQVRPAERGRPRGASGSSVAEC